MLRPPYLKMLLTPWAVLCLFLAGSCTSADAGSTADDRKNKEHGSEPRPDDEPAPAAVARTTGTTFLTDIKEVGIFNTAGRVTCMVIDRVDSNHLIAGAETGGLWSSHDRGRTWEPVDDHLPTLRIRSLAQSPFQSNTYFASSATIMTGTTAGSFRPDIYRSTDGGQTFQLLPATAGNFTTVLKVVCSPVSQNTIYALCDQFGGNRGVYRSQDNGQTFTSVFLVGSSVTDLEVLPNGTLLLCSGNQVFRSPNGNPGTFTLSSNGLTNTFNTIDVAFCQSQPNFVYGITTGGSIGVGVFKSTDAGLNWTFLQSLNTGIFTRAIGVKPDNPNVFIAGSVVPYLSQDGGSTFLYYPTGGVDYWSYHFDPHNPNKIFVTFDQGLNEISLVPFQQFSSQAYQERDSLFNCAQIYTGDYFVKGDKVIAGMQDLGTHQVWPTGTRNVASGDGGYCYFHKQDTTVAYGSYQNGEILKKTSIHIPFPQPGFTQPVSILNQLDANNDGDVDEGAFFIHPYWMNNADGEQLYYPTKKRLWRSINGGASWQPISGFYDLNGPPFAEIFMDGNQKPNPVVYWSVRDTLWIMRNAKTAAAGSELKVKLPGNIRSVRVDPANDSFVYITLVSNTAAARIFRSGNLFKPNVQWTDLTGDLPADIAVRCFEVNPQNKNHMIAGTGEGLYVSENGGVHWDKDLQLPNVNILRTAVRPSDKRIFIFTYGRGAWAASFPASGTSVPNTPQQPALTAWPNPTTGVVHVGIPSIRPTTTLKVWSADGRLINTHTNLQHTPCAVNLGDVPPGNYVLGLYEGGERVGVAKVVKK